MRQKGDTEFRVLCRKATEFYARKGLIEINTHCQKVVGAALRSKMIESEFLGTHGDTERVEANHVLTQLVLYHVLDPDKRTLNDIQVPKEYRNRIEEELVLFSRIAEVEKQDRNRWNFISRILFASGKPPLALLAAIADAAATHEKRDLELLCRNTGITRSYNPDELDSILKNKATIAKEVYARLAELFGYPLIAGQIYENAFEILHPDIYRFVKMELAKPEFEDRMLITNTFSDDLIEKINSRLEHGGFEAESSSREKHPGKIMGKIPRLAEDKKLSLEDYMSQFDWADVSDLVARRIVLSKFEGRDIDDQLTQEVMRQIFGKESGNYCKTFSFSNGEIEMFNKLVSNLPPLNIPVRYIIESITDLQQNHIKREVYGNIDYTVTFYVKDNGYTAVHFDIKPTLNSRNVEIQLTTQKAYEISNTGGAAHYYYLGGKIGEDVKLIVDSVQQAYQSIIGKNGNGKH